MKLIGTRKRIGIIWREGGKWYLKISTCRILEFTYYIQALQYKREKLDV